MTPWVMVRHYSFIPVFLFLLLGVAWGSRKIGPTPQKGTEAAFSATQSVPPQALISQRRELVETLDRIVAYEHYHRSVYGYFTKLLSRVGYQVPRSVQEVFEVRVAEASVDRLLVLAFSERNGKAGDFISVDQDYQIHANFPLPMPRAEYLRARALRHLRRLRESQGGLQGDAAVTWIEETGAYRNYFKYEVRSDSEGRPVAFAVGVRPPVVGMQLEVGPRDRDSETPEEAWSLTGVPEGVDAPRTGQGTVRNVAGSADEIRLAQKIFLEEMGRYARDYSELARMTTFRLPAVAEPLEIVPEIQEAPKEGANRVPSGGGRRGALIIEPIRSAQASEE